ncbi:hypothetical protein [Acidiferrobacter sp.]|uniref:hypothetical protein n=1 Tax=Acidiferrobacter sp. TaxID=1872107 RepID=UPI002607931F|nr:hypothetical protein [Acidiferrobacter sp.]
MSSTTFDEGRGAQRDARAAGWRGGIIPAHRGLRIMPQERGRRALPLLLGPVFALAVFFAINPVILPLWAAIEGFWCARAVPTVTVIRMGYVLPWGVSLPVPVPHLGASGPSHLAWAVSVLLTGVALVVALVLRRRHLPLSLALFTLVVVFAIGAAGFTPVLAPFPYTIPGYIESMLLMGLVLMFVTPLLFMAIYYPLDFGLGKKIGLTLYVLVWLAVMLPCQFCLQAFAINELGLIALPTLFLLSGLLLDVMGLVAFYAWGMSWRLRHE